MNNVLNIGTSKGDLRIWNDLNNGFCWATPNGSQGSHCDSSEEAVSEAFHAEGLNPVEYGYADFEAAN